MFPHLEQESNLIETVDGLVETLGPIYPEPSYSAAMKAAQNECRRLMCRLYNRSGMGTVRQQTTRMRRKRR